MANASAPEAEVEETEVELLPVEKKLAELLGEVEAELAEIEPKYMRLREWKERLEGKSTPAPAPAPTRTPTRRAPSNNGGVNRAEEFLATVKAEPGLQIPAIAERMGIKPNYLYRIRPKAEAEGKIRVDGQRIFPVEA